MGRVYGIHSSIKERLILTRSNQSGFHAVSVGECIVAIPIIKALKSQNPSLNIVVTTTTTTGANCIISLGDIVEHRYMPTDFGFAVRGFLKAISPKAMVIIETELWPNTLCQVHKAGIPITVVNARLSDKSRGSYNRIRPLFRKVDQAISNILCQSTGDRDNFHQLGVAPHKLEVTGSIKFDITVPASINSACSELKKVLGSTRPIWIAASTHKGEDEQILEAHKLLTKKYPDALLIIVPRHPERFDSVYNLCCSQFTTVKRSQKSTVLETTQVYLADTMGEMLTLIASADICFMGGELIRRESWRP